MEGEFPGSRQLARILYPLFVYHLHTSHLSRSGRREQLDPGVSQRCAIVGVGRYEGPTLLFPSAVSHLFPNFPV